MYLVLVGPEGADCELRLPPRVPGVCADVPDGIGHRPFIHLDQHVQRSGTGPIGGVQQVVKVDAVRVVLLHHRELKTCSLPRVMLGRVHHHVRACGGGAG